MATVIAPSQFASKSESIIVRPGENCWMNSVVAPVSIAPISAIQNARVNPNCERSAPVDHRREQPVERRVPDGVVGVWMPVYQRDAVQRADEADARGQRRQCHDQRRTRQQNDPVKLGRNRFRVHPHLSLFVNCLIIRWQRRGVKHLSAPTLAESPARGV